MDRWIWKQIARNICTFDEQGAFSLSTLYSYMIENKLLSVLFYDIKPPTLLDFQERFMQEGYEDGLCWLYVCYDKETQKPLMFSILNGFIGKAALCHFCVFSKYLNYQDEKKDIAKAWLDFMVNDKALSCLMGITPRIYKHAYNFAYSVGFNKQSIIPNACYFERYNKYVDGVFTLYTKNTKER